MVRFFQILLLLLFSNQILSQSYDRAFGVRMGITPGIEYKVMIDYEEAYQALFSFKRGGIQLTYLKLYHEPIFLFTEGKFYFYFGYGTHAGYARWTSEKYFFNGYAYRKSLNQFLMGVDGNVGIEYQFPRNPFLVYVDYKPYLELSYPINLIMNNYDLALGLRYSF